MRIKAIILCGGQGTRIRDVADDLPKPMISVGTKPILWHIMKLYAHYGINDFVLCLGYKGWVIKDFFLNYRQMMSDFTISLSNSAVEYHNDIPDTDWNVTLAETGYSTQTGGRLHKVRKYVEDADLVCVTYGDGLADLNISDVIDFHVSHGRIGTVTGVRPRGRFGVLSTDNANGYPVVNRFEEKPQALEGLINGGYFVFDQRLFNYVCDDDSLIFEHEPLQNLSKDNQLVVYEHDKFWQPMDTYREWQMLNQLWNSNEAPWKR